MKKKTMQDIVTQMENDTFEYRSYMANAKMIREDDDRKKHMVALTMGYSNRIRKLIPQLKEAMNDSPDRP